MASQEASKVQNSVFVHDSVSISPRVSEDARFRVFEPLRTEVRSSSKRFKIVQCAHASSTIYSERFTCMIQWLGSEVQSDSEIRFKCQVRWFNRFDGMTVQNHSFVYR